MEYFLKRLTSKFRYILYLNFDVKRFEAHSFSYGTSHMLTECLNLRLRNSSSIEWILLVINFDGARIYDGARFK